MTTLAKGQLLREQGWDSGCGQHCWACQPEAFAETPALAPNGNKGVVVLVLRVAFRSQGLRLGRWEELGWGRGNALGLL